MGLLVDGHSSKQIAQLVGLSDLTVRKHRENLMRKLHVHSIGELVLLARSAPSE